MSKTKPRNYLELLRLFFVAYLTILPASLVLQGMMHPYIQSIKCEEIENRNFGYIWGEPPKTYNCKNIELRFSNPLTFTDKDNCITLLGIVFYIVQLPAAIAEDITLHIFAPTFNSIVTIGGNITYSIANYQIICLDCKR